MYQNWFGTLNTRSSHKLYKHIKELDFIFLQEIEIEFFESLVKKLNLSKNKKFYSFVYKNNMGIITTFKIKDSFIGSCDVGYGTDDSVYIKVKIELFPSTNKNNKENENHLNILCIHLDKNSEITRQSQIELLKNEFENCDLIMGCFNSIYFKNYKYEELDLINEQKVNNGEEIVNNVVMNTISEYYNIDSFNNPTCSNNLRIDYILPKKNSNVFITAQDIIRFKNKSNEYNHYLLKFLIYKGGRKLYV